MADDGARGWQERSEGGISPSLVGGGIIVVAVVVFILQNRAETTVEFLFVEVEQPLWAVLALTAVLSILGSGLVGRALRRRRRRDD